MGHFVPHTDAEIAAMLGRPRAVVARRAVRRPCPTALRLAGGLDMPPGLSEPDVAGRDGPAGRRQPAVGADLVCFAGGGRLRPRGASAVTRRWRSAPSSSPPTRRTSPRWPRACCRRCSSTRPWSPAWPGSPIANASLYDGATRRGRGGQPGRGRHRPPDGAGSAAASTRTGAQVLATFAAGTGHDLVDVPLDDGVDRLGRGRAGDAARRRASSQYPNYLGVPRGPGRGRAAVADRTGALLVVGFDPVSAGLLRAPGECGADVVVGEGQPFGTPLSLRRPLPRAVRLPPGARAPPARPPGGRDGRHRRAGRAYVTTLRAREQDIRREKASSNVCTNQTLIAVTAADPAGVAGHRRACASWPCAAPAAPATPGRRCSPSPASSRWPPAPDRCGSSPCGSPVPADGRSSGMAEEGFLAGVAVGCRRRGRPTAATACWWRSPSGAPGPRSTPTSAALEKVVR